MKCPKCATELQQTILKCPVCQQDVTSLQRLNELPGFYWNVAILAIRKHDYLSALENLAVVRALQPDSTAALNLAGKVCIQIDQLDRAQFYFRNTLKIDAGNQEAKNAISWLFSQGVSVTI